MVETTLTTNLQIAKFLDEMPSGLALENIHDRVVCVFGSAAWSAPNIRKYLGIAPEETSGGRARVVEADNELEAFFTHHRSQYTLDQLLDMAKEKFPDRKLPSRSSLSRFLSRTRSK